jgi:hypothetical protein
MSNESKPKVAYWVVGVIAVLLLGCIIVLNRTTAPETEAVPAVDSLVLPLDTLGQDSILPND